MKSRVVNCRHESHEVYIGRGSGKNHIWGNESWTLNAHTQRGGYGRASTMLPLQFATGGFLLAAHAFLTDKANQPNLTQEQLATSRWSAGKQSTSSNT